MMVKDRVMLKVMIPQLGISMEYNWWNFTPNITLFLYKF